MKGHNTKVSQKYIVYNLLNTSSVIIKTLELGITSAAGGN